MALGDTARLIASLELQDKFTATANKIEGSLGRLEKQSTTSARVIGTALGVGLARVADIGISKVIDSLSSGIQGLERLETLGAQTEAVLKSTGGAAGISADQVRKLAEAYESLNATIDDKVIQNTENLLLTFTDIRKEAFEPALAAILDMNTALGKGEGGLQDTAIQVGKALQDPIRGLTTLRRAGVNFTEDQQRQVKALVATGDALGAQRVILAELNREFKGSFAAQGNTTAGRIARVRDAFEDLQISLASGLLPALDKIAGRLGTFLAKPETVRAVKELGDSIAGLFSDTNLNALQETAGTIGNIVATAVGLFQKLPPELQKVAIGALAVNKLTGGAIMNLAGSLLSIGLSSLKTITAANVTVVGASVTSAANLLPAAGAATSAAGAAGSLGGGAIVGGVVISAAVASAGLLALGKIVEATSTKEQLQAARLSFDEQAILKHTGQTLEQIRAKQNPAPIINLQTIVKTNVFGTTATTTTTYNRFLPGGIQQI